MACRRNNEAVGTRAARANGVTESSSRSASLAKGDRFNLATLTELVRKSMTSPKGAQTSPQSKWARLDRVYRLVNPGAKEADLKQFQAWRRRVVAGNVRQFHEAIEQKRKVSLYYPDASSVRKTTVIPLDVKGGLSSGNKHGRYMWGYAEKTKMRIPIPVDKVLKVETTGEAFDPAEAQRVSGKRDQNEFNLKRDWAKAPDEASQKQEKGGEKKKPKVGPGANLKGADLAGIELRGLDLSRSNLSQANLSGADLMTANLSEANLAGANLRGANLSGANLDRANLQGANLAEAKLDGANLAGANLSKSLMTDSFLSNAQLQKSNLAGVDLSTADLRRADFQGANLRRANLWGADLFEANMNGAELKGADLQYCSLKGTDLTQTRLEGVSLERADTTGCKLPEATTKETALN